MRGGPRAGIPPGHGRAGLSLSRPKGHHRTQVPHARAARTAQPHRHGASGDRLRAAAGLREARPVSQGHGQSPRLRARTHVTIARPAPHPHARAPSMSRQAGGAHPDGLADAPVSTRALAARVGRASRVSRRRRRRESNAIIRPSGDHERLGVLPAREHADRHWRSPCRRRRSGRRRSSAPGRPEPPRPSRPSGEKARVEQVIEPGRVPRRARSVKSVVRREQAEAERERRAPGGVRPHEPLAEPAGVERSTRAGQPRALSRPHSSRTGTAGSPRCPAIPAGYRPAPASSPAVARSWRPGGRRAPSRRPPRCRRAGRVAADRAALAVQHVGEVGARPQARSVRASPAHPYAGPSGPPVARQLTLARTRRAPRGRRWARSGRPARTADASGAARHSATTVAANRRPVVMSGDTHARPGWSDSPARTGLQWRLMELGVHLPLMEFGERGPVARPAASRGRRGPRLWLRGACPPTITSSSARPGSTGRRRSPPLPTGRARWSWRRRCCWPRCAARSPMAKTLAALDVLTDGRLVAGLGPGSSQTTTTFWGFRSRSGGSASTRRWRSCADLVGGGSRRPPASSRCRPTTWPPPAAARRDSAVDRKLGLAGRPAPRGQARRRLACVGLQHDARRLRLRHASCWPASCAHAAEMTSASPRRSGRCGPGSPSARRMRTACFAGPGAAPEAGSGRARRPGLRRFGGALRRAAFELRRCRLRARLHLAPGRRGPPDRARRRRGRAAHPRRRGALALTAIPANCGETFAARPSRRPGARLPSGAWPWTSTDNPCGQGRLSTAADRRRPGFGLDG